MKKLLATVGTVVCMLGCALWSTNGYAACPSSLSSTDQCQIAIGTEWVVTDTINCGQECNEACETYLINNYEDCEDLTLCATFCSGFCNGSKCMTCGAGVSHGVGCNNFEVEDWSLRNECVESLDDSSLCNLVSAIANGSSCSSSCQGNISGCNASDCSEICSYFTGNICLRNSACPNGVGNACCPHGQYYAEDDGGACEPCPVSTFNTEQWTWGVPDSTFNTLHKDGSVDSQCFLGNGITFSDTKGQFTFNSDCYYDAEEEEEGGGGDDGGDDGGEVGEE